MFYEILHGQRPWTAGSMTEMVKNIETKSPLFFKKINLDIQDLITKMLKINESDKINLARSLWSLCFENCKVVLVYVKYFIIWEKNNESSIFLNSW